MAAAGSSPWMPLVLLPPGDGAAGSQSYSSSCQPPQDPEACHPLQPHVFVELPAPSKSAPSGHVCLAAPPLPLPGRQRLRRHQFFLATSSALNLLVLVCMPDVAATVLLSATAACALSLFAVVPRLSVPIITNGHTEVSLSRRAYRCCAVVATCDLVTLAWWAVVLVLMVQEPDQALHDALPLLVAVGCALLGVHAGLSILVARDSALVVRYLDTTGTMVRWWTWLALGVALAMALLLTGCLAAFLLLVMGSSDCVPTFSTSFYD